MNNGWAKIKQAAKYAGVSERTFRDWLKQGLRYSRLQTGHLLIKYSWIDEFLEQYENHENQQADLIDKIIGEGFR
jgi:excisionase family DNA binding protein